MKVTFDLSDDLFEELTKIASNNHITLEEVLEAIVTKYVNDEIFDDGIDYNLTEEELIELKESLEQGEAEVKVGRFYTQKI